MKSWSSVTSQRVLRFLLCWFSLGAFVGLICFIITPLYLTWLLFIEFSNVLTILKWRSVSSLVAFHSHTTVFPTELTAMEREDVNFRAAISDINTYESSFFYIPLQEHVQS